MAKQRIIVSERDNIAAIFEGDKAVEFISHRGDIILGDVFLAAVENILPSIDAAFVNVGSDKMGFLHASDAPGKGDLTKRLQPKQHLVVQVMKEPTGHKGPRVTTNISLPGRFLVFMPQSRGISISRKVEDPAERARLKAAVSLIKPPGVGVIIRTEAEGQKDSDIQEDFETLMERWQNIVTMADTSKPPALLYRDQDLLYRVIREGVSEDITEVFVDTQFGQQRAQQLLQNWNLDRNIKVNLYSGNQSIVQAMGVDREIKLALQSKVPMPSGGYLYVQQTEALCVIDVNSGKFTSMQSQAETIRLTNLEACKEIARQLRLRNIGGMIIVDFIDMESRAHQLQILQEFEKELVTDKAKPQVGQISDLGLVEMTRHRQGQSLSEIFTKKCIACNGTGRVVDEFNWAPPNIDLSGSRQRGNFHARHRLPIKHNKIAPQSNPQQQGSGSSSGSGGNGHSPERNRSGNSSQSNRTQQQPLSPRQQQISQQRNPVGQAAVPASATRAQAQASTARPTPTQTLRPLKPSLLLEHLRQQKAQAHEDRRNPRAQNELPSLDSTLKERLEKLLGGHQLADITRMASPPPAANSVLSRINPKANNVFTLVDILEGNGGSFSHDSDDDDDSDDDSDNDTEQDNTPDNLPDMMDGRRRHRRARSHDSHDADDNADDDSVPDEAQTPEEQPHQLPLAEEDAPDASDTVEGVSDEEHSGETVTATRRRPPVRSRRARKTESDDVAPEDGEDSAEDPLESAESDVAPAKPRRRRGRPPKKKPPEPETATVE